MNAEWRAEQRQAAERTYLLMCCWCEKDKAPAFDEVFPHLADAIDLSDDIDPVLSFQQHAAALGAM